MENSISTEVAFKIVVLIYVMVFFGLFLLTYYMKERRKLRFFVKVKRKQVEFTCHESALRFDHYTNKDLLATLNSENLSEPVLSHVRREALWRGLINEPKKLYELKK